MSTRIGRWMAVLVALPVGRASMFLLKSLVGLLVVMAGDVIPPF